MNYYGDRVTRLISALSSLPGIGAKSAQRMAFHIINMPEEDALALSGAISDARKNVKYCSVCCNLTDSDVCGICSNASRDPSIIMVVEDPRDMAAYEKTNSYKGLYHVLHGAISPMLGIAPSDLRIQELIARVGAGGVNEIILATNANIEGEATAIYLSKLIKPLGVRTTRIANGVPMGGSLEYVDDVTLSRALEGRREI